MTPEELVGWVVMLGMFVELGVLDVLVIHRRSSEPSRVVGVLLCDAKYKSQVRRQDDNERE